MITEKDLENQNTFFKYGRGDSYEGYWYQGTFDCGVHVYGEGKISFFLHDEVYGKKWHIRNVESLEDLQNLYNTIYNKTKFKMEINKRFY